MGENGRDVIPVERSGPEGGIIMVPGEYLDDMTGIEGATVYLLDGVWHYEDAFSNVGQSDSFEGIIEYAQSIENV